MLPRSRAGRIGLHLLTLIELAAAAAFFVALGFALGPGVIGVTAVITIVALGWGYLRGRKRRELRRSDPVAARRMDDRDATRLGKMYAGFAFVTMGVCIVAIVVIFATHA
jgi:anaerobic C4-dicarboxylate transporter